MRSKRKVYRNRLSEGYLKVPLCGFGGVKCVFVFSREIWSWFWAALKVDRAILSYLVSYNYTVRSNDVKVLKSPWNFVQTTTTTPGNNIYTLLITFNAFTSFISSKFQTLFLSYKLSYYAQGHLWYYAWTTCEETAFFLSSSQVQLSWPYYFSFAPDYGMREILLVVSGILAQ